MILFKFKELSETRGDNYPCSAFRWTFQIGFWYIGFVHQSKSKFSGSWNDSHTRIYEICIINKFKIGMHHYYYDGPHCSFSLGWLRFCWGGNPFSETCIKCEGPYGNFSATNR
jgi:hypothetical protein